MSTQFTTMQLRMKRSNHLFETIVIASWEAGRKRRRHTWHRLFLTNCAGRASSAAPMLLACTRKDRFPQLNFSPSCSLASSYIEQPTGDSHVVLNGVVVGAGHRLLKQQKKCSPQRR
jgi:hypothetical protein